LIEHEEHIGEMRNTYRMSLEKPEGKGDIGVDGRIILKCTIKK